MDKVIDFVRDGAAALCSAALRFGAAASKKAMALLKKGRKALRKKQLCAGRKKCSCAELSAKLRPAMKALALIAGAVSLLSGLCFFLSGKK